MVALEGRLSTLEVHQQSMSAKHAARMNDMENRLSRNKVRAIGIPEKKNSVTFIENWLITIFGKGSFSPMFSMERAHRVPPGPLPPGHTSRSFLFKILNYKDSDVILSKARFLGVALVIDNYKVLPFPDFSVEVQKQRPQFTEVKKRLRALDHQYAMLYLAPLRVVAKG